MTSRYRSMPTYCRASIRRLTLWRRQRRVHMMESLTLIGFISISRLRIRLSKKRNTEAKKEKNEQLRFELYLTNVEVRIQNFGWIKNYYNAVALHN